MERLSCSNEQLYRPLEAAIHIGRYAPALALCSGRRVLDAACGEGYGSYLMARSGALEVAGIDVSPEATEKASTLFRYNGLHYRCADATTLDELYPEHHFDLVVSLETIEHLKDPVAFLRALKRVATEDATIIISCPNDHWYYPKDKSNPYHLRKYHFDEFRDLTVRELGNHVRWYLGTPALGFMTVEADARPASPLPSSYVDTKPQGGVFACRPDEDDPVGPEQCAYFLGVWRGGDRFSPGAAVFPMTMDRYARLHTDAHTVTAALQAAEKSAAEAREAQQKAAQVAEELCLTRVKLNALRREADILTQSLRERDDAPARVQERKDEIARLKEALAASEAMVEQRWAIMEEQGREIARLQEMAKLRPRTLITRILRRMRSYLRARHIG